MKREILERGYITHCLTNGENKYYNNKGEVIHEWSKEPKPLYWSEIYCEPNYMSVMIRKGTLLVNPSNEELMQLHKQSIVNCQEEEV